MALDSSLADDFGSWGDSLLDLDDGHDSNEEGEDDEASSRDEEEGEEALVGKRRRWAPTKGLVVELSTEASRMLSKQASKFFEGPGTIRHVSLDGCEVRVEWDVQPGVHVAYPTGYMDRFYLRVYAPPVVSLETGTPAKQPAKLPVATRLRKQARGSHDELEDARRKQEQEREKRRQQAQKARDQAKR
jgi:hypothetical protein